jgi:hypothetical protein
LVQQEITNIRKRRKILQDSTWLTARFGAMALAVVIVISGCGTLPRNAVPIDRIDDAQIPGFTDVRAWSGRISEDFQADFIQSVRDERLGEFPTDENGIPVYHGLALSGGGSAGAFGAGFLYGWGKKGTRPDFKLVTGISTGALIAPFAYLGSDFDEELKEVYTTITSENIMQRRNIFAILFKSESLAKTDPLKQLVEQYISEDTLRAVAQRHDRGHRLYIGTTHMDAQRLVVWNMGLIAKRQSPEALDLFRKVMLASVSIPVAFPPVHIEVEIDGKPFDEMHADGGTLTQVFYYMGTLDAAAGRREIYGNQFQPSGGGLYIIRNGQVQPEPVQVDRNLAAISSRAIDTMIKAAVVGDLYRIYAFTSRDDIGFNYAGIPEDYEPQTTELFDKAEMNRLFQIGYQLGMSGNPWQSTPPGFEDTIIH